MRVELGDGPEDDPALLYAALRAKDPAWTRLRVELDVPGLAPTGSVLRVVDAIFRAGGRAVGYVGPASLPRESLRETIARARRETRRPKIRLNGSIVGPSPEGGSPMPAMERVRGRPAGDWEPTGPTTPGRPSLNEVEDDELPEVEEETEEIHATDVAVPRSAVTEGPARERGAPVRDQGGRPKEADDGVEIALRWLAAQQRPDGSWESPDHPVGVTGLALLAFLGAGYSDRGEHRYARVVGRGLRYLIAGQADDGGFGPRTDPRSVYDHAIATLAILEAYGLSETAAYREPAQRALDFVAAARNPGSAWRYGVRPGDDDTSVTGWMMMPLKSAQVLVDDAVSRGKPAPFRVDPAAFEAVVAWIDRMTDPETGRVGYRERGVGPERREGLAARFPPDRSESNTAVGLLARLFAGEDPKTSDLVRKGAQRLVEHLPLWSEADGTIDFTYWYFGTLAAFQVGGSTWRAWDDALLSAVLRTQRPDGSWDPLDPWGPEGGPVYSTALLTMCLEVYYRYDRVFGTK